MMQGACFLRLLEHVANARGAHADEHFDEIRAGDGKERPFASPAMARASSVCRSGRPDHEHAFRDLAAKFLELPDLSRNRDFYDFLLRLFDARHVRESDVDLIFGQEAARLLPKDMAPALRMRPASTHEVGPNPIRIRMGKG